MEFAQLIEIVQTVGIWAVFAFLYWDEKKSHQVTRQRYYDDLREIAGLRRNIDRVQTYVRDSQQFPAGSEMTSPSPN